MSETTFEQRAEIIRDAVRSYLEQTACAHDCAGWSCKVCSVDGERGEELKQEIYKVLR